MAKGERRKKREEIRRFMISDTNVAVAKVAPEIPVMWEWPTNHGNGGHVLYLDGNVKFVSYPGKFPMSEKFIWELREISPQISKDVPPIVTK